MKQRIQAIVSRAWNFCGVEKRKAAGERRAIVALDGVRAIAALLVVTLHLNEATGVPWDINQHPFLTALSDFGRTGVDLFFILSGFLLFLPYARALLFDEQWPALRTFYVKRMCRIWPGYYVSLWAMILWYDRQYLQPDHWKRLALFLTFFMDSSPKTWQLLNGPFWTLAIEWQFYLVLPLIAYSFLWVARHVQGPVGSRRLCVVLGCCLGLLLLSLSIRGVGVYHRQHPQWTVFLPARVCTIVLFFLYGVQGKYLEIFAMGMLVSVCYTYAQRTQTSGLFALRLHQWSPWMGRAGFFLLIGLVPWQLVSNQFRNPMLTSFTGFAELHPLIPWYAWLGEPLAGVGYGLCVLAILSGSSFLRWFCEWPYLRWIGQISYGLYIWNQRMLDQFELHIFPRLPAAGGIFLRSISIWAFVLCILLPLCTLFYRFIEQPGIYLGKVILARQWEWSGPVPGRRGAKMMQVKSTSEH